MFYLSKTAYFSRSYYARPISHGWKLRKLLVCEVDWFIILIELEIKA